MKCALGHTQKRRFYSYSEVRGVWEEKEGIKLKLKFLYLRVSLKLTLRV